MRAMILAAGRGTRMGALTETTPKPLLPLAGMPLIEYHVRALAAADIREIVINVSWLGDQIIETLGDGQHFGVDIIYSQEPDGALETAGGIANALPLLGSDPFMVVNGDIWSDFPLHLLRDLSTNAFSASDCAHLVMVNNPEHHQQGDFYFVSGQVTESAYSYGRLYREPVNFDTNTNATVWVKSTFSGMGLYRAGFFESVSGRQALGPLLHDNLDKGRVSSTLYTGLWWDVGTPERLATVERFLRGSSRI